ncbi:hypothetical protein [Streptomyces sp. NPDC048425]|uniref:hypothetical protein n=1 Tax=Streptomyces sp. NPDC048425 TaxID=3365548 RepID=UPI003721958C
MFVAAVALAALVVRVERHASAPALPPSMLTPRSVVLTSPIGFVANTAMFSLPVHLPTYLQIAEGSSATLSGVRIPHLVPGLVISQSPAGSWATRVAPPRLILAVGMLINVAGLLLLSTLGAGAGTVALSVYFAAQDTAQDTFAYAMAPPRNMRRPPQRTHVTALTGYLRHARLLTT